MEDIRKIQINNNFTGSLSSTAKKRRIKAKSKNKIKVNYFKLKTNLIRINIIGAIFAIVLLASSYSNMVKMSSNNLILKEEIVGLKSELNNLESIAMTTNSLSRIEKVAKSRLGMDYPNRDSYVALENTDKIKLAKEKNNEIKTAENDKNNSVMSTLGKIFGSGE